MAAWRRLHSPFTESTVSGKVRMVGGHPITRLRVWTEADLEGACKEKTQAHFLSGGHTPKQ